MLKAHEALSISNAHKAIKTVIPNIVDAIKIAAMEGALTVYYHATEEEACDNVDDYVRAKFSENGYCVRTEYWDTKEFKQPIKGWTISWRMK
jgi:hypothetical protein